jgi:hypothetical protein
MFQHANGFPGLGHEIHATGMEGMTLGQPFQRQPCAFHGAVVPNSFNAVSGTGRVETAAIPE